VEHRNGPPSQIAKYHSDVTSCNLSGTERGVSVASTFSARDKPDESSGRTKTTQKLRTQKRGTQDGENFETDGTKTCKGTRAAGETTTERSAALRIQRTQGKLRLEKWRGRRGHRGNSSRAATVARRMGPNDGNRRREELDHYPSLIEVPKQHLLRSVPSDRAIFESQDRRTRESCALDVRWAQVPMSLDPRSPV